MICCRIADNAAWRLINETADALAPAAQEGFIKLLVAYLEERQQAGRRRISLVDLQIAIEDAADTVAMAPPMLN